MSRESPFHMSTPCKREGFDVVTEEQFYNGKEPLPKGESDVRFVTTVRLHNGGKIVYTDPMAATKRIDCQKIHDALILRVRDNEFFNLNPDAPKKPAAVADAAPA